MRASACGAYVRRAGLARAEKSLGAGRHECPRHFGNYVVTEQFAVTV
jgi:hypothetical protein